MVENGNEQRRKVLSSPGGLAFRPYPGLLEQGGVRGGESREMEDVQEGVPRWWQQLKGGFSSLSLMDATRGPVFFWDRPGQGVCATFSAWGRWEREGAHQRVAGRSHCEVCEVSLLSRPVQTPSFCPFLLFQGLLEEVGKEFKPC